MGKSIWTSGLTMPGLGSTATWKCRHIGFGTWDDSSAEHCAIHSLVLGKALKLGRDAAT